MENNWKNMIFRCVISALLACSIAVVSGIHIPGKIVHTTCGPVEGTMSSSRERREYYAWLGIPFAKAPVASRRFQVSFHKIFESWRESFRGKCDKLISFYYNCIAASRAIWELERGSSGQNLPAPLCSI